MDIKEAIFSLRTIRKFDGKQVSDEKMNEIMLAGVQAPSSCNQQLYKFIVIKDENVKKRLEKEATFRHIKRIPTPVFIILDDFFNKENSSHVQGVSATIQNMLLYAHSIGIAGWWINGYGDRDIVRKVLNIPKHYMIVACVGFGYPDEKPIKPIKQVPNDITYFNTYSGLDRKNRLDPNNWPYEEIVALSERAISAKSPEIGYFPLFADEFKNEIEYISKQVTGSVLNIAEISGIFLFALAKKCPDSVFTTLVTSQKMKEWFESRAKHLGLENTVFIEKELKDVQEKYDTVLCLDFLNRVPDKERKHAMSRINDVLNSTGKGVVYAINRRSLYGYIIRKGKARRFGPEISLGLGKVKGMIRKGGLEVQDQIGFALVPGLVNVQRKKIPHEFERFRALIRLCGRFNMLEKYQGRGLRSLCRTNLFLVRKRH